MGHEFELKYRADARVLAEIEGELGDFTSISMETAYYDTPGRFLGARKWMLRLRLENGVSVCTLKTPGDHGERGEWEAQAGSIREGLEKLCKLDVPRELASLPAEALVHICGAKFTRRAKTLQAQSCTLELALDAGCFLAGHRQVPFFQVEVELKEGPQEAAVAYAAALTQRFHLEPEPKSKAQQAFALANLLSF